MRERADFRHFSVGWQDGLMRNRWIVLGLFYLSSVLNYLDRSVMAALSPLLRQELGFDLTQYGWLQGVFSAFYAFSAPIAGLMVDRYGLTVASVVAVGFWSLAGMSRGLVGSFSGLMATHTLMGVGESAGIPSTAKASHRYLKPDERAFGPAMSQVGLCIGAIAAPTLFTWIAVTFGWRWAFIVPGALGLLWIPLWLWTDKNSYVPEGDPDTVVTKVSPRTMLRDPFLWGMAVGNFFSMATFSLWTVWTTEYFVKTFALKLTNANYTYAWLPQVVAGFGALSGAWFSRRLVTRGMAPFEARRRTCLFAAFFMMTTGLVPLATTPAMAMVLISVSFFAASVWGVNYYTLPVDVYGQGRAGFAVSFLTASFGVFVLVVSPVIGAIAQRQGFAVVCYAFAFFPLIGFGAMEVGRRFRAPVS